MRIILKLLLFTIFHLYAIAAFGGDCKKTGTVCMDSSYSKDIGGITVYVSQIGGCWEYKDTYTCIKPNAVNYCQPFINAGSACWQTNSSCVQMDTQFGTGCMKYSQTWRCGDPSFPTPANTTRLNETYTLVSSNYDASTCTSLSGNSNCTLAESKCISATGPSLPPGISSSSVAPDGCYKKQDSYVCFTGKTNSTDCDQYSTDSNCSLKATQCSAEQTLNGKCAINNLTYRCMTTPPKTKSVIDCSGKMVCSDGTCFDTGYENDKDFGKAAALMEGMRQAGVYGDLSLFAGEPNDCRIKLGGVNNCCKKSDGGGGNNNSSVMGTVVQLGYQAAGIAVKYGSAYVYDSLMSSAYSGSFLVKGFGAITGAADLALADGAAYNLISEGYAVNAFQPSLSTPAYYGMSISWSSTAGFRFAFDPYSLAIQVAIQVIMEIMSCDQTEKLTSMKKGQNLCVEVGDYCSKKALKICYETKKVSCCFNSRLARIINEQGRAQIGKGWGSPQSPNCSGFTTEEFERIDFSQVDMAEFVAEIMDNVKLPSTDGLKTQTEMSIQNKIQNYYSQ